MKKTLLLLVLLLSIHLVAQDKISYEPFFGEGHFTVKGKVVNKPEKMQVWRLAVTGYLNNEGHDIEIKEDSSFHMDIPIRDVQDVYLYVKPLVTIFTYPGDTIELEIDGKSGSILEIKGKNEDRQKQLDLSLLLAREFRERYVEMHALGYNREVSDSAKLARLNKYYDDWIEQIQEFRNTRGDFFFIEKYYNDVYYDVAGIVCNMSDKFLDKVHCAHPKVKSYTVIKGDEREEREEITLPYKFQDYDLFRMNCNYRDFLEVYIHKSKLEFDYTQKVDQTPVKDLYYLALANLKIQPICEWYVTKTLDSGFTYYDFEETNAVYQEFRKDCQNEEYLSLLEQKHTNALATQPGEPAPDFELPDENGNMVRLSDLKGKIVYIDFWGVGCGPCIYEFKNSKDKMKEKYKEHDIVYVYICVDVDGNTWKSAIKKHNLDGINLVAKGWEKHPACQSYNVKGVPHYVLIDKEGKIAKNKCQRPSIMLMQGERSDLEKLIARYKQ